MALWLCSCVAKWLCGYLYTLQGHQRTRKDIKRTLKDIILTLKTRLRNFDTPDHLKKTMACHLKSQTYPFRPQLSPSTLRRCWHRTQLSLLQRLPLPWPCKSVFENESCTCLTERKRWQMWCEDPLTASFFPRIRTTDLLKTQTAL